MPADGSSATIPTAPRSEADRLVQVYVHAFPLDEAGR